MACGEGPPKSYWPDTTCPQPNRQDRDDVCLIQHPYQTRSHITNFKASEAAISPDGHWVAIGGGVQDGTRPTPVLLVEVATATVTDLTNVSSSGAVAFSPDSSLLAATGMIATSAADGSVVASDALVRLWQIPGGTHLRDLRAPIVYDPQIGIQTYDSVLFSPDGRWVIAGRSFGDVIVWDAATGAVVQILHPPRWSNGPDNLSISADGTRLVVAAQYDGPYVTVYDLTTGDVLTEFDVTTLGQDVSWPQDVAISPDGTTVAIATDCAGSNCIGVVWLWDLQTRQVQALRGHVLAVYSVIFDPRGRWLASGGADNSIRLWDWHTGREIYRMEGAVTQEMLTGTPAPGIPANAGGLGSDTQGYWAPVNELRVTADGSILLYSEPANGQTRMWRLPEALWRS